MGNSVRLSEQDLAAILKRFNGFGLAGAQREGAPIPPSDPVKAIQSRKGIKRGPSELELQLAQQISLLQLPAPAREYKAIAGRDFRLDFAWVDRKLGLEVQGMVHRIKGRFKGDIEKRALHLLAGWRVLEVSGAEIRSGRAAAWLVKLLGMR